MEYNLRLDGELDENHIDQNLAVSDEFLFSSPNYYEPFNSGVVDDENINNSSNLLVFLFLFVLFII
jgi:hypothetical protein